MTSLSSGAAFWFLITQLPLALYVMWDDLAHLKIRNTLVLLTLGAFIAVAVFTLPWTIIAWRLGFGLLALTITFLLFSIRLMGGGDAKYIAAITPIFAWQDWPTIVVLFCVTTVGAMLVHRILRATIGPTITPNWKSWTSGKRFPLGFPLATLLLTYLSLAAINP